MKIIERRELEIEMIEIEIQIEMIEIDGDRFHFCLNIKSEIIILHHTKQRALTNTYEV